MDVLDQLCDVVTEAIARGGVMLVASFAVGRAQQLIYLLQVLMRPEDGFRRFRSFSTARWRSAA